MSTSQKITFTPQGLKDAKGNFILSSTDIQSLLKFCWTGALLATTEKEYQLVTSMTDDALKSLKAVPGVDLDALLAAYAPIKQHTTTFKDQTYPLLVTLASDIYAYAKRAGGKPQGSYYADMVVYAQKITAENQKDNPDQTKITAWTKVVTDLVGKETKAVDALVQAAGVVVKGLTDFQTQCIQDKIALVASETSLTTALTGENGAISKIKDKIASNTTRIAQDEKDYEQDVIDATTALTYCWIFPFGTIAAAVVAGVYGARATALRDDIASAWKDIADEQNELSADVAAAADVSRASTTLQSLIDQIDPAVKILQLLMGVWGGIRDDLTNLEADVTGSLSDATDDVIEGLDIDNILGEWNDLADKVDFFRLNAYVSAPPPVQTIAQVQAAQAGQPN